MTRSLVSIKERTSRSRSIRSLSRVSLPNIHFKLTTSKKKLYQACTFSQCTPTHENYFETPSAVTPKAEGRIEPIVRRTASTQRKRTFPTRRPTKRDRAPTLPVRPRPLITRRKTAATRIAHRHPPPADPTAAGARAEAATARNPAAPFSIHPGRPRPRLGDWGLGSSAPPAGPRAPPRASASHQPPPPWRRQEAAASAPKFPFPPPPLTSPPPPSLFKPSSPLLCWAGCCSAPVN
jgi:hypothetical protein